MKLVYLCLTGIAVCTFSACERQPYSKVEAMTAEHAKGGETGHPVKAGKAE